MSDLLDLEKRRASRSHIRISNIACIMCLSLLVTLSPLAGCSTVFGLHYAALKGDYETASRLIAEGSDVNATSSADGNTPLHTAAYWGSGNVAALLIAKGADIDVHDPDGLTPPCILR